MHSEFAVESGDDTEPDSSGDEGLVMKKVMPKVTFSSAVAQTQRGRLGYVDDDKASLGVDYDGGNDTF